MGGGGDRILTNSGKIPSLILNLESILYAYAVQQLEKEGAKAISLQPDEPVIFEDESYVMGKRLCSASKEEGLAQ